MRYKDSLRDHIIRYKKIGLKLHLNNLIFNPSYRLIYLFRILQSKKKSYFTRILTYYYTLQCNKFGFLLDPSTVIGDGIIFPHSGPIIINPKSTIGKNCIIHPCVLIGGNRKDHKAPTIGDNVFIGHGAKIIGGVEIGNNVFISPGAIITKNVPDDCIIGGGVNNFLKYELGGAEVARYQEFNL